MRFSDVQSLMELYQEGESVQKRYNMPVCDVVLVHELDALVS
jgi:hypothetical protein